MDVTAVKNPVLVNNYPSTPSTVSPADGVGSKVADSGKPETVKNEFQLPEKDEKKLTREDVNQLTDHLNKFMKTINTDLQFVLHEETHRMIVQFVDRKDQRVIKEFPPHELLDTLAAIRDYVGVLLDKRV